MLVPGDWPGTAQPMSAQSLHARAWTARREGRRWYVAGELTPAGTGSVLGRGEAVMVLRDAGHFARHQEWLVQQDAEGSRRGP